MKAELRVGMISLGLVTVGLLLAAPAAKAGCGCDKPPPPPASVRPSVAYAGAPVSLFVPTLSGNQQYTVTFANGISGQTASVPGSVSNLRDLADGQYKSQLVVPLPRLPLGPTSIVVTDSTGAEVSFLSDWSLTVAPDPVVIPGQTGSFQFKNYQAAVGRDGVVYLSLDLSNVQLPIVVEAQANGYALRFGTADVLFDNIQGFLMQQLVQNAGATNTEPIPGMFVFPAACAASATTSDILHYSRHEFETYFIQHQERLPHAVDPSDPNWHLDGTRHVDHNHLIVALKGHLNNGSSPAPGTTSAFTLQLKNYSLFYQGLVGASSVTLGDFAATDAFSPATSLFTPAGDVFTNGSLTLNNYSVVNGAATASSFSVASTAKINGPRNIITSPMTFMQVKIPSGIPNLGSIILGAVGTPLSQTITGPGSFLVSNIAVSGTATLIIDNSAGPVSLYVTGYAQVTGTGRIVVKDPNPEKFAIYVPGTGPVKLAGNGTSYGVVYAPNAPVSVNGNAVWYGAFVGKTMTLSGGSARVHYFSPLRGQ